MQLLDCILLVFCHDSSNFPCYFDALMSLQAYFAQVFHAVTVSKIIKLVSVLWCTVKAGKFVTFFFRIRIWMRIRSRIQIQIRSRILK